MLALNWQIIPIPSVIDKVFLVSACQIQVRTGQSLQGSRNVKAQIIERDV